MLWSEIKAALIGCSIGFGILVVGVLIEAGAYACRCSCY
jgi:hypothetical protein